MQEAALDRFDLSQPDVAPVKRVAFKIVRKQHVSIDQLETCDARAKEALGDLGANGACTDDRDLFGVDSRGSTRADPTLLG